MHCRPIGFRRNETSHHGRQPIAPKPKRINVPHWRKGHGPGIDSAWTSPFPRVQVSFAPSRLARHPRHRFSIAAEGYLRERLFLACPWVPDRPSSEIPARVLVTEARRESPEGCSKHPGITRIGLGGVYRLAMPNQGSRGAGSATHFLSGTSGENSDRQFSRNPVS
jgi:hypothetical protein